MRRKPFAFDLKLLMGASLWMSALSAGMVTFLLFVGLDGWLRGLAAVAFAYGVGAVVCALEWREIPEPSLARWYCSAFFAALPLAYALLLSATG
jgi:hypothetical protein